jgi:hypothetical protein
MPTLPYPNTKRRRNSKLVSLYGEGFSLNQLARRFRISRQRANQLCIRAGVSMRPRGRRPGID